MNQSILSGVGVSVEDNDGKSDKRLLARNLITKSEAMIYGKFNKTEKDVVVAHLAEVYELFIQQSLQLVAVKNELEQLSIKYAESEFKSYANVTQTSAMAEEPKKQTKQRRPEKKKGKTRAAGPTTDHVVLVCPKDKCESNKSLVKKAINPLELHVKLAGKRPLRSGDLLVRLSEKKDAEILERAILENEKLKDTRPHVRFQSFEIPESSVSMALKTFPGRKS